MSFTKYAYVAQLSFKNSRMYPLEMLLPAIMVAARLWVFALLFQAAFSSKMSPPSTILR